MSLTLLMSWSASCILVISICCSSDLHFVFWLYVTVVVLCLAYLSVVVLCLAFAVILFSEGCLLCLLNTTMLLYCLTDWPHHWQLYILFGWCIGVLMNVLEKRLKKYGSILVLRVCIEDLNWNLQFEIEICRVALSFAVEGTYIRIVVYVHIDYWSIY